MAKKENKLNPIFGKANLSDARWINTPFAYTEFFSGLSLLQQDVMFKVSDSIQGFFKDYFGDGRHLTKDVPRPLFTEEEKKQVAYMPATWLLRKSIYMATRAKTPEQKAATKEMLKSIDLIPKGCRLKLKPRVIRFILNTFYR